MMTSHPHVAYTALAAMLLLCNGGCSRPDDPPGPTAKTASEAQALDDAAAMLKSRETPRAPGETATAAP